MAFFFMTLSPSRNGCLISTKAKRTWAPHPRIAGLTQLRPARGETLFNCLVFQCSLSGRRSQACARMCERLPVVPAHTVYCLSDSRPANSKPGPNPHGRL